jgi:alkylhydroperoxidase family enzyme
LQLQGAADEQTEAIRRRDIENAVFTNAERALLRFVKLVTETAYRVTADETQTLRDAGWTDPQIAEAVYITALFAFFNRVADAFGLEDPGYTQPDSGKPPDNGR